MLNNKWPGGLDSSFETQMMCMGYYEINPPIYENLIE